jgi:hypothetical protein
MDHRDKGELCLEEEITAEAVIRESSEWCNDYVYVTPPPPPLILPCVPIDNESTISSSLVTVHLSHRSHLQIIYLKKGKLKGTR